MNADKTKLKFRSIQYRTSDLKKGLNTSKDSQIHIPATIVLYCSIFV